MCVENLNQNTCFESNRWVDTRKTVHANLTVILASVWFLNGERVALQEQTDISTWHKFAVLKAFSEALHLRFS